MKKRFWYLAAVGILVLGLAAPAAFGAVTGDNGQNQTFFNQMFDWHQKWLDQAQKDGQITPDQANVWQNHFNYMRDFHGKSGFGAMGAMMGNYSGNGYGRMMGGFNGGNGYGGMMGGGFNSQAK